ncbi:hypothetical protein BGZ60DRAFT_528428 [Tricladium varicosporioides]|nr:hypothetical protein BGZ60DRAFT_528428 [Hymenoscyphus varicosporioides]
MTSSSNPSDVDLNDQSNLDLYTRLVLFKNDKSQNETLWQNPDKCLQRSLQSLAHKLDLEYEYSLHTRVVRISRTTIPEVSMDLETEDIELLNFRSPGNNYGLPSTDLSMPDSPVYDTNLSSSVCLPHISTPGAASNPSMVLPDLSKWPALASNDFLRDVDAQISSAESKDQHSKYSAQNLLDVSSLYEWSWPSPMPNTLATEVNYNLSRTQSSYDSPLSCPSNERELQNGPQQTLDLFAKEIPSVSLLTGSDLDTDDSETRTKPHEHQRFYCTEYPPCKRSFTRSDLLARHVRKHPSERPFQCHCGRKFTRLVNLRQHAQTVHGHLDDLSPADPLNAVGSKSQQQIQRDKHRPLPLPSPPACLNNINFNASTPTSYVSRRGSTPNVSETWPSKPEQPTSRSGSVSSFQSDWGRNGLKNMFSRRSSAQSRGSTGYQEIVFDSKSVDSGSQASGVSGRQGPLDSVAIAAMNAVKRIGACWRCKFLRKSCSPETPCDLCPKGNGRSNWDIVGCKRGDLKTKMPPITLCPQRGQAQTDFHGSQVPSYGVVKQAIEYLQHIEWRSKEIKALDAANSTSIHGSVLIPEDLPLGLTVPLYSSIRVSEFISPALIPLNECILAIAWELGPQSSASRSLEILGDNSLESLIALLRSSAIYQAKLESDQLIAQSLICLRSCLEAMNVDDYLPSHAHCHGNSCKVKYISDFEQNITLYLDELSRVFFRKENLKTRSGYWISAFYSFCIQAIVRKVLLELLGRRITITAPVDESLPKASEQFLHLAVNLFIASSGTYDPLTTNYSATEPGNASDQEDIVLLQQVLGGPVHSSAGYLRKLFEIKETQVPKYQYSLALESPLRPPVTTQKKRRAWYTGPVLQTTTASWGIMSTPERRASMPENNLSSLSTP